MSPTARRARCPRAPSLRELADGRCTPQQAAERAGYAHLSHLNAALRRAGLGSAGRYRKAAATASQEPVAASCGA